jgi:hypothetical protein
VCINLVQNQMKICMIMAFLIRVPLTNQKIAIKRTLNHINKTSIITIIRINSIIISIKSSNMIITIKIRIMIMNIIVAINNSINKIIIIKTIVNM